MCNKRIAGPIRKLVHNAKFNAINNHNLDAASLYVGEPSLFFEALHMTVL